MKKLVMLFMLVAAVVMATPPEFPRYFPVYKDATGTTRIVSELTPMPVQMLASGGATATVLIPLPAIGLATRSFTILSTSAVTLLQDVASFSDRSTIWFQPRSKIYWSVTTGSTTATPDLMQSTAYTMEAGDTPFPVRLMKTSNIAFVADDASIATLTYTIAQEQ